MNHIRNSETYFAVLSAAMQELGHSAVDRIASELLDAYRCGRSIYIFGNGGSAATASHFACDLGKGSASWLTRAAKRFRVIALTDNVPVMTAWANDADYADIFAEQLRNLIRPGDVVVAISSSGQSANIIKALEVANRQGAHTIGLGGCDGGRMKPLCRTCLVVSSNNVEVIEDVHMAVCHAVATIARQGISANAGRMPVPQQMPEQPIACSSSVTFPSFTELSEVPDLDFESQLPVPRNQAGRPDVRQTVDAD